MYFVSKSEYIIDVQINRKNIDFTCLHCDKFIHVVYLSIDTRIIPTASMYILWMDAQWTTLSLRQQQEGEIVPVKHDIYVRLIKTWHLWLNSAQTDVKAYMKTVCWFWAYLCQMGFSFVLRSCRTLFIRSKKNAIILLILCLIRGHLADVWDNKGDDFTKNIK